MLKVPIDKSTVIIGIGNTMLGDDGVGIYVTEHLKKIDASLIFTCGISPENYLGKICKLNPSRVIIIDAVNMGKEPGAIDFLKGDEVSQGISTHNAGLDMISEFIYNSCGAEVIVAAIQPERLYGEMSGKVRKSADDLIEAIKDKLCTNQ